MVILGIDMGSTTRAGFGLVNSQNYGLMECSCIPYDKSTPYNHRRQIVEEIERYMRDYVVDAIVFEAINLYSGSHISKLNNILTLARVQTTIIDSLSDKVDIYKVNVRSWKAVSLGSAKADKDDSVRKVKQYYPDVDLDIEVIRPRKKSIEIEPNHDMADAIMIAKAICMEPNKLLTKANKMNYL